MKRIPFGKPAYKEINLIEQIFLPADNRVDINRKQSFPGASYEGKQPNNGTEYLNSPIGKQGEIFGLSYSKMLGSVRIISLFLRVRLHFPIS